LFKNRVLRRIFGPKMDGVTREQRKQHNEGLNDLSLSLVFSLWAGFGRNQSPVR
jgi:hypothetical protein